MFPKTTRQTHHHQLPINATSMWRSPTSVSIHHPPMVTNPIRPTATAATPTRPLPPAPKPNPVQPTTAGGTAPTTTTITDGRSPITSQHRDPKSGDYPDSIVITFLTGQYKGQRLELGQWLGTAINESSHTLSAQWAERDEKGVRSGLNFEKLGGRTFSITVEFFDLQHDISHLVENLACLQQISGDKLAGQQNPTPPLLGLRQGDLVARPVVCTQISPKYSEPHSGDRRGFRRCVVELSFQLAGGKDSEHALGKPLTSTPLTDWLSSTKDSERDRQGRIEIASELLAPCLGEIGNRQLRELLDAGRMAEPEALEALDDGAFTQLAIGGAIRPELMKEGRLADKLGRSLASSMAAKENGVGAQSRQFAHSLETGDLTNLPQDLRAQAVTARTAYQQIMKSLQAGDLNDALDINSSPESATRLRDFGRCGLSFRQIGAAIASSPNRDEQSILGDMKAFLGSNPSPSVQDVKAKYGLESDAQAKQLINGHPYSTKQQFLTHMGQNDRGMEAQAIWNRA